MSRRGIFILIAILWVLIAGGFIAYKEYTLRTGMEVLLETVPVDPRDLFRGDYVTLSYKISALSIGQLDMVQLSSNKQSGQTVYVGLDVVDGYAQATSLVLNKPESRLFIKGKLLASGGDLARVSYGIESYFVPEGKGLEIERFLGDVDVRVVIDKDGNALIKELLLDGEVFDL